MNFGKSDELLKNVSVLGLRSAVLGRYPRTRWRFAQIGKQLKITRGRFVQIGKQLLRKYANTQIKNVSECWRVPILTVFLAHYFFSFFFAHFIKKEGSDLVQEFHCIKWHLYIK